MLLWAIIPFPTLTPYQRLDLNLSVSPISEDEQNENVGYISLLVLPKGTFPTSANLVEKSYSCIFPCRSYIAQSMAAFYDHNITGM